ncbi:hypothetical protein CEUSTIGMA_g1642.t1 [Chlamydomonas eustigma]|uniref:DNA replication licensing factor MCM2 n=1 Tax=Chlamydomonas eustigma TaxID=1157962 RepID=A0A250WTP8_9CHLO|nr:hypothetical protein CEUSTIGMA_g1642.t1 [Chlamydomonas eustigma]|eukprot:GAX74193.1 hypothetical protein CEUSTIGMA_g1642.t1 [Chlamydomonas eustigma]
MDNGGHPNTNVQLLLDNGDDVNVLDRLEDVSDEEQDDHLREDEEGEGEDLLDENMGQDYRRIEHLDRYESEGLEDDAEEVLEEDDLYAARAAAEREIDARRARAGGQLPAALEEDAEDSEYFRERRDRRRRRGVSPGYSDHEEEAGGDMDVQLGNKEGRPLSEFVTQPAVVKKVQRVFMNFLLTFQDEDGSKIYTQRIKEMQSNGKKGLEVVYSHISLNKPTEDLGSWLADDPLNTLTLLNKGLEKAVKRMFPSTEENDNNREEEEGTKYQVRITDLPLHDKLRELRSFHLNNLVRVSGVVTRRTGVFPQLRVVMFDCAKCGHTLGPFTQNSDTEIKPQHCPNCSGKGPFNVNSSQTVYRDYQKLTLQESPGTVPAGRLPRQKEVILLNDLIDCARPGEEIDVTGIYIHSYDAGLNVKNGFPVFSTCLEANYIQKREDVYSLYSLTDEDKGAILDLGKDPRIGQRIIKSIAPSIYGHEFIKTALAMALLGGQEKHPSPAYRLRGDINILLLGDPGVAKSQFLKYVEKTATRAVYTTGKGASAVGLTASVHRDAMTKEWVLEGGALVLADKGVCLIDEFDKMNEQDRVSIHEAMEQQSISISKAGIVTSLQARCAVIAAANPVGGRYDPSKTFSENVELSDPILSRFDVLCVVRDQVDPVQDQRLAEFVVGNHMRSHPVYIEAAQNAAAEGLTVDDLGLPGPLQDPDIIPQDLLRKYVTYAKQNCKPQLQQADYEKLMEVYSKLRQEASRTHGMPIAVRHLESLIRMSEAHARMHLRDYVSDDDMNIAIKQMLGSFIQSQKYSVHKTMERRFKRYLTFGSDYHQLLLSLLRSLLEEVQKETRQQGLMLQAEEEYRIPVRSLEDKAREHDIADLQDFYASNIFESSGFKLNPGSSHIVFTAA